MSAYHPVKALVNWYFARHVGGPRRPVFFEVASVNPGLCAVTDSYPVIREEFERLVAGGARIPRYHDVDPGEAKSRASSTTIATGKSSCCTCSATSRNVESGPVSEDACEALDRVPYLVQAFFSILVSRANLCRVPPGSLSRLSPIPSRPSRPGREPSQALSCCGRTTTSGSLGEAVMFDDTWPHEVVNRSPDFRAVLIIDVLRPNAHRALDGQPGAHALSRSTLLRPSGGPQDARLYLLAGAVARGHG